jgi:hypothetical protein
MVRLVAGEHPPFRNLARRDAQPLGLLSLLVLYLLGP